MMYTRIAVPLDGSERALAALGPARRLARLHGASLGLVTVIPPDATMAPFDATVTADLRGAEKAAPELIVLRGSDAASELACFNAENQDTLMCLTTRARRLLGRMLFGSVARELVRQADEPLALVGPSCDVGDAGPIQDLLVALDGTPGSESILPWATRWSRTTGARLVLVRVVYPLVEPAARVRPTEEQLDALGYVKRLALRLEREGHRVADATVQHPWAPDALVDLAANLPGAVVALSTANPRSVTEALDSSTAAQVVRGSSVPVIVRRRA